MKENKGVHKTLQEALEEVDKIFETLEESPKVDEKRRTQLRV